MLRFAIFLAVLLVVVAVFAFIILMERYPDTVFVLVLIYLAHQHL